MGLTRENLKTVSRATEGVRIVEKIARRGAAHARDGGHNSVGTDS